MAPTELEMIALDTEFQLYMGFVKRLVIDLPDSKDRVRAALWLLKLRNIKDPEQLKLRNEHLKLFLFALHRRALVGLFEKRPPKDELESFHDGLTLMEMTRELISIAEKKKTKAPQEGEEGYGICPLPPVKTNLSYDLKEYAASQEIPRFGAHCYYAVSSEPIQMWTKGESEYPSRGDPPNQYAWEIALAKVSDHVLEREAEIDAAIEAAHEAEHGFVFDEGPEEGPKEEEPLEVTACSGGGGGKGGAKPAVQIFKWQQGSMLQMYQNYDFSDVGIAEDLEEQGKHQLEMDEEALQILDTSLPGRQRIIVRAPWFDGLPADIAERRHHGIYEDLDYEDAPTFCPPRPEEDEIIEEPKPEIEEDICPCDEVDHKLQTNLSWGKNVEAIPGSNRTNGYQQQSQMTPSGNYTPRNSNLQRSQNGNGYGSNGRPMTRNGYSNGIHQQTNGMPSYQNGNNTQYQSGQQPRQSQQRSIQFGPSLGDQQIEQLFNNCSHLGGDPNQCMVHGGNGSGKNGNDTPPPPPPLKSCRVEKSKRRF